MIFLKTNVKTRSHKYARWNGYIVLHNCRSVAAGLLKNPRSSIRSYVSFWKHICVLNMRLSVRILKYKKIYISSIIYCILFTSVHYNFWKYRNINLLYIHVYTRENFSMLTSAPFFKCMSGFIPRNHKNLDIVKVISRTYDKPRTHITYYLYVTLFLVKGNSRTQI